MDAIPEAANNAMPSGDRYPEPQQLMKDAFADTPPLLSTRNWSHGPKWPIASLVRHLFHQMIHAWSGYGLAYYITLDSVVVSFNVSLFYLDLPLSLRAPEQHPCLVASTCQGARSLPRSTCLSEYRS